MRPTTIFIEHKGKTKSLNELANDIGVSRRTLDRRLSNGLTGNMLFKSERIRTSTKLKFIEYHGEVKSLSQWADEFRIPYNTLYNRYKRGLTIIPEPEEIKEDRVNEGVEIYHFIMKCRGRNLKAERLHSYKQLNEDYKILKASQAA